MISEIQQRLLSMKDEKYLAFHSRLVPETRYPLIGVRVPRIRSLAKELQRSDWKDQLRDEYYEEVLLHAFCIAQTDVKWEEKKQMIEAFLPSVDNWAICDSFVSSLKEIRKHREDYYPLLCRYLESEEEFIQRYALVVLLNYYIDENYLNDLYRILVSRNFHGYYSRMAAAWLLSFLFLYDFPKTVCFLQKETVDPFVYKKGIQKALDSCRLNSEQKQLLKTLR